MGKRAGRTPASNSAKKAKSEDDWVGRMMKALQQLAQSLISCRNLSLTKCQRMSPQIKVLQCGGGPAPMPASQRTLWSKGQPDHRDLCQPLVEEYGPP